MFEWVCRTVICAPTYVLDFWCLPRFGTRSPQRRLVRKLKQNFALFAPPPVKIKEWLGETSRWIFCSRAETQPLIYFWLDADLPSEKLESGWQKSSAVKQEGFSTYVRLSEQAREADARVRTRVVIGDGLVSSSSSSKPVNGSAAALSQCARWRREWCWSADDEENRRTAANDGRRANAADKFSWWHAGNPHPQGNDITPALMLPTTSCQCLM